MKQIKFRAWHKAKKRMLYGGELNDSTAFLEPKGINEILEIKSLVFLQFTGLKIKGKELYEGDIVLEPTTCLENENTYYEVKRSKYGEWILVDRNGTRGILTDHSGFTSKIHHSLRIVGNKYENPNLLKGKNGK